MLRHACAVLSLLIAACAPAAPDPRGVAKDEVLLQVSATGRAETRPDEARILVGVETLAGSSGEASRINNARMNAVVAALKRLGIVDDDLRTRTLTLGRIDYGKDRGRFRAENQVEVRVRDIAKAGPAIAAATEAGGNVVQGPDLRVADPEAAARSAYAAAYREALARAKAYAEAAGLEVRRPLVIRDGQGGGTPFSYISDAMEEGAPPPVAAPPPIQAGTDTKTVRVSVDFALGKR